GAPASTAAVVNTSGLQFSRNCALLIVLSASTLLSLTRIHAAYRPASTPLSNPSLLTSACFHILVHSSSIIADVGTEKATQAFATKKSLFMEISRLMKGPLLSREMCLLNANHALKFLSARIRPKLVRWRRWPQEAQALQSV